MSDHETLVAALRRQAETRPDDVFCTYHETSMTFGEFARRVSGCAQQLRERGVDCGHRVALMMRNHVNHVVVGFAVRWVGAIHVPVSVHHKELGLQTQLSDVQPALVIADEEFVSLLSAVTDGLDQQSPIVDISELHDRSADILEWPTSELDDVAMIAYTSGTSGPPKGAMISERFLELGRRTAAELAGVHGDDVLFQWEPFHHIAGWISVHMSIMHGVRLAMVDRFSASRCWQQIRETRATKLHHLGGVIDLLLAQPPHPDDQDHTVSVVWGAAAPAARWREFEERFGVEVREGYGLSEAANFAMLNINGPIGSIGRAIEEFDAWIAEPGSSTRLGPGQPGEIVLRAKDPRVVMRGYFRDPDKTREVLERNGLVRTGDLGYVDADGWFYYSGRVKDSLRRRGENVSAWEVERVVNSFDGVEDSAVIGVDSAVGEQDIKVVISTNSGEDLDLAALVQWCRDRLAYYQVPRYLEVVDELPYGPTQRVQKALLSRATDTCYDLEAATLLISESGRQQVESAAGAAVTDSNSPAR